MRFLDLLRMSSSNLWKRKLRTILTILGVIIGTAAIVVMISIGLGLNKSAMDNIEKWGGLTTITVSAPYSDSYMGGASIAFSDSSSSSEKKEKRLDDALVEELSQLEHVEFVAPVISLNVVIKSGIYENTYATLMGMTHDALIKMNIPQGQGRLPDPDSGELEFYYGNMLLAQFQNRKNPNDNYWFSGELPDVDLMNDTQFVIFDQDAYWQSQGSSSPNDGTQTKPPKKYVIKTAGVAGGGQDTYGEYSYNVYCDLDILKTQLKRIFKNKVIPGQPQTKSGKPYKEIYYSGLQVSVDDMNNMSDVQKTINDMGYQASSNAEWIEQNQQQYGMIQAALGGIGAISLLVAAIGIANTMMMSIYERTKEIGIMKVLGCDLRNIQTLFLLEAADIGLIGGIIGVALSGGVSAIINRLSADSMQGMTLSYIPPWLVLAAIVFSIFMSVVAGFFPSRRAMKLSPLAAIRSE